MQQRYFAPLFAVLLIVLFSLLTVDFTSFFNFVTSSPGTASALRKEDREFLNAKLNEASAQAPPKKTETSADSSDKLHSSSACMNTLEKNMTETGFRNNIEQLMNRQAGAWLYSEEPVNPPLPTTSSKFLYALAQMNGLETKENIPVDTAAASILLSEVSDEDPENSAPLIMALVIQDAANDQAEVQKILKKLETTKRFENPMYALYGQIFDAVQTPENLILAYLLYHKLPVLDYESINHVLKKYPQANVARQFIENGLSPHNTRLDIDWSAADYSLGLDILKKLNVRHVYPDLVELYIVKKTGNSIDIDLVFALRESNCSVNNLVPLVETMRKQAN